MSGRRVKLLTIVVVLLASALTFLAWSQSWGSLTIIGDSNTALTLDVPGSAAAPALSALALAGLALAGALAIAGPVSRIVLGALEVLLGASVLWSAIGALTDPVATGSSVVTTSTGVAGLSSIRELVTPGPASIWPSVTVVLGTVMVLAGLVIVITVRRWPAASRKYQAVTYESADGMRSDELGDFFDGTDEIDEAVDASGGTSPTISARDAAVDDWDSMTRGTDPTTGRGSGSPR